MTLAGIPMPDLVTLDRVASAAGWTLVHSFWQGLIVWGIVASVGRWVRLAPRDRLLVGNVALAALAMLQVATFVTCLRLADRPWWNSLEPALQLTRGGLYQAQTATPVSWTGRVLAGANSLMPLMLAAWAMLSVGQIVQHLRASRAVATTLSLAPPLPPTLLARCRHFAREMGVDRPVQFVAAAIGEVPGTVGWLRPYIFVPPAVLLGMPPSQVEAIVLHELAHILRRDYAMALLHAIAEAIYVGNPFVRAIVRRLRNDAELCCDEIAARHFGDARGYAGALVAIADAAAASRAVLSARGGVLTSRILSLLDPPLSRQRRAVLLPKLLMTLAIAAMAVSLAGGSVTQSFSRQAEAVRLNKMSINDAAIWILGTGDTRGNRGGLLRLAEDRSRFGETKLIRAIIEPTTYADGTIDAATRDRLLAAASYAQERSTRIRGLSKSLGNLDDASLAQLVEDLSHTATGRFLLMCDAAGLPGDARPRIEAAIRSAGPIDRPSGDGVFRPPVSIDPSKVLMTRVPRKPIFTPPEQR